MELAQTPCDLYNINYIKNKNKGIVKKNDRNFRKYCISKLTINDDPQTFPTGQDRLLSNFLLVFGSGKLN